MANTVQIRPELIKAGYTDADIGYDEGRKMTTLKGQDFLGAGNYTNVAGSTFTDRQNFDSALKKYNLGQQPTTQSGAAVVGTGVGTVGTGATGVNGAGTGGNQSTPYVDPEDQKLKDMVNFLYNQAWNPQPVDVNAIYGSPQWAAAQAQTGRQVAEGQRQSREGLNRRGLFDSSLTSSQANQIAQQGTEYLNLQMLPQLMAQEEARRRAQTQDQFSVLDAFMKQKDAEDRLRIQEGQLTGRLMSDQDRAAQPLLDELTRLGQAWQNAGGIEEKMAHSAQADRVREQLAQMGVDPSLYDPSLSTEQRMAAGQGLGTPTMAGREYEAKARAAEAKITTDAEKAALDSLWKAAEQTGMLPNELADFYGLPQGTKTLDAEKVGISRINAQTSARGAETSRMNAELARTKYTDILGKNEFSSQVIAGLNEFDNAEDAQDWLNANGEEITKQVGFNKFLELQKAIPTFFGKDTSAADAKSDQAIRSQAIGMAQNDNDFSRADAEGKEEIIQEYITLLRGS